MEPDVGGSRGGTPPEIRTQAGHGTGRGVVHTASEVADGSQCCVRCGTGLPLPEDGSWEPGALIEHRVHSMGEEMSSVDFSEFPPCRG